MLTMVEKVCVDVVKYSLYRLHSNALCFVVIMPPSALDQLTRLNVVYPMLFKLTNSKKDRITHAGVLEFVADEGKIYIPYWVRFPYLFSFL